MQHARAGRAAALLALWLLPLAAVAWPSADDTSAEAKLARWLQERGGALPGYALGQACPTCLRGVVASKALREDEVIIAVPQEAVLELGHCDGMYPSDMARRWLAAMHNDAAHNATWGLFWATQPGPDEVFTLELMNDAQLDMLQCEELVTQARMQQDVTEQVYKGTWPDRPEPPFWEVVPQARVSEETFKYVTHLYGTRAFGHADESGNNTGILVPLAELINHSDSPNAHRTHNGTHVVVQALQDIEAGEELTINYQPGIIHRPDLSLYIYGFVIPREQPLLASVDLPGFDVWDVFKQTPPDDSAHEAGGEWATAEERERLAARLASLPTREAEDQALLDSGKVTDWRERTILQWRVQRKRALRQTLERLAEALGPESSPEAAPGLEGASGEEAAAVGDTEQQDAVVPADDGGEQAEGVMRVCAAALLLLALLVAPAAAWPRKSDKSPEAELSRWIKQRGGRLRGFALGQACPTCLRGVVASRDLKAGDVILEIPFESVLRLKDPGYAAFASEYAHFLLQDMHNDAAFNDTWKAFWATQPGPDGVLTAETFTDEIVQMLQCSELEQLARGQRGVAEQVFAGTYPHHPYKPLSELVPEGKIDLNTFLYMSSLLGSRYFGFYRDGQAEHMSSHLVPLLDLINHADDPNAERGDNGTHVFARMLRPVKKGEEITNSYQPGVIHRPDMSLYIYGFVVPQEQPLLSAVDLPHFNISDPFKQTALDDSAHQAGGQWATAEERDRLVARLASLPTSEAEDQALLDSGKVTDWRQQAVLQWRVQRKRALRQAVERLEAALAGEAQQEEGTADAAAAAGREEEEQAAEARDEL